MRSVVFPAPSEVAAQTRFRGAADPFDFAAQETAAARLRLIFGIFAFLFCRKKIRVRTFAGEKFAVVELNDAGCDAVEKAAVVSDEQTRAAVPGEELLDSRDGLHVEMVGGFVEQQQIRFTDNGPRKHDPAEFASRKLRTKTVQVGYVEFCERDLQFFLRTPRIMKSQQMFERLVFRRIRRERFVTFQKRVEPGEPLPNRLFNGEPCRRRKILRHIGDADSARDTDVAARGLLLTRDDFQQGRLPAAVASDQRNALLIAKRHRGVLKQRLPSDLQIQMFHIPKHSAGHRNSSVRFIHGNIQQENGCFKRL